MTGRTKASANHIRQVVMRQDMYDRLAILLWIANEHRKAVRFEPALAEAVRIANSLVAVPPAA